ncbi:hypothetical protein J31TS4_46210 [Paenibacillus sp. J31TS4]|uniref:TraX family protein n=1 Tax=Paenibacillus sp. J31TS4 TaxID=2807195 RepID=UPI001B08123A|nr:TraX family protein [Paenibacillus sp. J31TS4]GIP41341.1 hypothetical protein J31TS4_46210 [Paenibacillus sp. J31TS4]
MKLLAMLTMLLDHIGAVFLPEQPWLRWIGRLAFPLYAYSLVQGYLHTRSLKRYMLRLLLLGLLAQLPFQWALGTEAGNAIGTLLVSLAVLSLLDRLPAPAGLGICLAAALLLEAVPFDYGMYGLLLVLIYRYTPADRQVYSHLALNAAFLLLQGWLSQLLSVAATALLHRLPEPILRADRRVTRCLWRSFYPAHLAVLALLKPLLPA